MKPILLALAAASQALFCCAGPAHAVSVSASPAAAAPAAPAEELAARPSLAAHLQLRDGQIQKLSRLYDDYAAKRLEGEDRVMRLESRRAQSQGEDEGTTGEIRRIKDQVADDLLSARGKALKGLSAIQRAQLQALPGDARLKVRRDKYFQLLLLPASEIWSARVPGLSQQQFDARSNTDSRRDGRSRRARSRSGGGYGVYGGYGYGQPQYGVYGTYGRGPVGVHAGIGRGGPSIGIGVGRVFGYGR